MDTLTLAAFLFVLGVAGAGMWLVRRARRARSMTIPATAPAAVPVRPPAPSPAPLPDTDPASPFQEPLALMAANLAPGPTPAVEKTRPAVFAMRIAGAAIAQAAPPPGIPSVASAPSAPNASGPRVVLGSTYLQTNRMSRLSSFQVGKDGEDRIAARICDLLDAEWYMFRNVVLPDRKGDIDIVLVGPGGIWALEVKAYTGNYKVENGKWYKETSNGYWARDPSGPCGQVRGNATRLCNFLKENGVTQNNSVQPRVILARDLDIEVLSSATEIWPLDTVDEKLAYLQSRRKLTTPEVETIAAILTRATQVGALLN